MAANMIQEGLLWFDSTKNRTLADKVRRAVQRYEQKHGHRPDVCCVHPYNQGDVTEVDGIKVLTAKTVLPFHFWLGVLTKKAKRETMDD